MFSPLESVLEVLAEFDHFSAPTAHRRILLSAVAMRNHDHGPEAGTDSGKGNTLTKVAPRDCDHSSHLRIFALKLSDVEHGQKIQETSKIASISTVMFSGKLLTPTADRACLPASPKTSTSKSEQPLITFGWSRKSSDAFTNPVSFTTRRTVLSPF